MRLRGRLRGEVLVVLRRDDRPSARRAETTRLKAGLTLRVNGCQLEKRPSPELLGMGGREAAAPISWRTCASVGASVRGSASDALDSPFRTERFAPNGALRSERSGSAPDALDSAPSHPPHVDLPSPGLRSTYGEGEGEGEGEGQPGRTWIRRTSVGRGR